MFVRTIVILYVCSIIAFSEAAFVDTLKKCSVTDEECLRKSFGDTFKSIGETGVPELGITPFDPLDLKNQTVSVLDIFYFDLINGKATGIKNCNIDKFAIYLDKGVGVNEFTCDLTIEGKYKFEASSPIFKALGSDFIHGDGNGKVEVEKLHMKFDFPVRVQRREGDIYLKYDYNHVVYEYEFLGGHNIFFDDIYVGGQESSQAVKKFIDDNWSLLVSTFANPFFEKGMKITFSIVSKFYNFVPAKYYLADDLSSYA